VTLFLAYLLMFMPRALINLRAGIAQAPVELENVAQSGKQPGPGAVEHHMRLPRRARRPGPRWSFSASATN
jgi:iron(III) transport system permease protein